jgi:mRNA interferase RelE/StbE
MKYEVKWTENALRSLKKLSKDVSKRVIEKVEEISEDPFRYVKKLKGFPLYSLRVGVYRVILSIEAKNLVIFVVEVGHRRKIYRKY